MSQRNGQKQTKRRTLLRVLFVGLISGDRELNIQMQTAADALRTSKTDVESALFAILDQFDELLARLVRDRRLLEAVGASFPTSYQLDKLSKVWGEDYAVARKFFVEAFGEESWAHLNLDHLITRRVEQLVRNS